MGKCDENSGTNNSISNADNCINPALAHFFSLPPAQFALLSALLGVLLTDNLDADQQNSLGNFIVGVGQTILVSAAQAVIVKNNNEKNDHLRQQIKAIKKQIGMLEKELEDMD